MMVAEQYFSAEGFTARSARFRSRPLPGAGEGGRLGRGDRLPAAARPDPGSTCPTPPADASAMIEAAWQFGDAHGSGQLIVRGGIWCGDECVFEFVETLYGTSGTARADRLADCRRCAHRSAKKASSAGVSRIMPTTAPISKFCWPTTCL